MDRKGKHVNLRVIFLDDQVHAFQVHVKAFGQVLWEAVVHHLNLLETDYFDLEYEDAHGLQCWLDREKAILKQLPNPDRPLYFLVKFYTPDPTLLEDELTRYLLALQIKRDLMRGNLPCSENTVALLISYVVQAEIGDYPIEEYEDHTYLSVYGLKYVPNQTEALERKICEYHKQHVGETPAEADGNLLDTARKVDLYGIRVSPAKDHEGVPLNLAVASMGILVFQGFTKINTFSWAKIRKLSFKRKKFLIKLHPENYGYYKDLVEFFFETRDECKGFWKKCIEHHTFFRCHTVKKVERHKTRVISRGSSFRYSGRTQKELCEFVRDQYVKRQPFQRTVSGRISSRSTSVTPKIPAKTSSLHNSADLHNSTASSGSHILDQSANNHQLTNQVESVDIHSDSSLSGSRSLGSLGLPRSPKKDEVQGHNEEVAESTNGATYVPDVPYPGAEGTGTVIQEEHRDKGGYIKYSNISNQSCIIVECHSFRQTEYAAAVDDKNEEAKVGTVDNTKTQSANQNANDNDDNISQASYHLEGENPIEHHLASSSSNNEVIIDYNNPLACNDNRCTNITYNPDSTHDALCGTENRTYIDRVPIDSYSPVNNLSVALEENKTVTLSDLPHACILQEVEKLTMGREVIVDTANLTQTVQVSDIKILANDMSVKAKVTLAELNISKPMQEDWCKVDRNTQPSTCFTGKTSIEVGDENVEPSKSNKNNSNVLDQHNDVETDGQKLMNQFSSCKKSVGYGTDLIEDIPYFLHRRHVKVGLEQKKEAELYTALENALNNAYNSSSAASLQRGRSAKRPANMQIQQLKADELPSRSASMPASGSKRIPSQSPIRKTSRIFASRALDRSLSEKRSPISKESLSRSRSPSCHTRLELVSFHRLPRKDNFSSVDDTANLGTDIASPRNQKLKVARGKMDSYCADISISSSSKSTDISMSSPSESSYSGSVYLASMSTDSSPSPTQAATASTASTSGSSTSIASIKSNIISNPSPSAPVHEMTQSPDDSFSCKSSDIVELNRCMEGIYKEIGSTHIEHVSQVSSFQLESSFSSVNRNRRDLPIQKEVTQILDKIPVLHTLCEVKLSPKKTETDDLIPSSEQIVRTSDRKDMELDNFPAPLSCSTPSSPMLKYVTDQKVFSSTSDASYISLDSIGKTHRHTTSKELELEVTSSDLCENDIKVYDESGTNLKSPSDLESSCSVAAMLLTPNSTGNSAAMYGRNVVTFSTFKPQEMDDKNELKLGSDDAKLAENQADVFNKSVQMKYEKAAKLSPNIDSSYHNSRHAVPLHHAVIHRSISPRRSAEYMKRVSQGSPELLQLSIDVAPSVRDEVTLKRHSYHGETEEALQEKEQRRKKSEPKRVSFHETVEEIADAAWMAMLSPSEDEPSENVDGSLETQTGFEPDFFLHLDASGSRDQSRGSCYDDVIDVLEDLEGYSENFCPSTGSPSRSGSESDDESENSEDNRADEFYQFAKRLAELGKETTLDSGDGIDMSDSFGTNQDTSSLSPLDPLEKLEELFDFAENDATDPNQNHELFQPKLAFSPEEDIASSSGDNEEIEVSKKEKRASIDPLESLEDPSVAAVVTSSDESSAE